MFSFDQTREILDKCNNVLDDEGALRTRYYTKYEKPLGHVLSLRQTEFYKLTKYAN